MEEMVCIEAEFKCPHCGEIDLCRKDTRIGTDYEAVFCEMKGCGNLIVLRILATKDNTKIDCSKIDKKWMRDSVDIG